MIKTPKPLVKKTATQVALYTNLGADPDTDADEEQVDFERPVD